MPPTASLRSSFMRRHPQATLPCSVLALCLLLICPLSQAARQHDYTILERAPHDPDVFTQGFVLDEDWFYESSGHYGRSFLLRYAKHNTSQQEDRLDLPRDIFAEGITVVDKHLYLLSWRAGKAWRLDKNSLEVLNQYSYSGEGWGLAHDGKQLILSDGSDVLRFYSDDFELRGTLKVRLNGKAVQRLNELEYHDGLIWANQWLSNTLYGINARSGAVEATVELERLQKESALRSDESVLNGIAYDAERDAFWITGKYWRHRYLLRFSPAP